MFLIDELTFCKITSLGFSSGITGLCGSTGMTSLPKSQLSIKVFTLPNINYSVLSKPFQLL